MMIYSKELQEVTLKYSRHSSTTVTVTSSKDAENIAREIYRLNDCQMDLQEYFYILLLNRSNKVVGFYQLSRGGISGTIADVRLAFTTALKSVATSIVLVHNHPSGNMKPSKNDVSLTKKFKAAGDLLDIQVLDHIILTSQSYLSFVDEGLL